MATKPKLDCARLTDTQLAHLAFERNEEAVTLITQRNNRRLYRAAWSILRNHADAEDAVQTTYLKAISAMDRFDGRSSLSTWLTRIAINEALMRRRQTQRWRQRAVCNSVAFIDEYRERLMRGSANWTHPDAQLARDQLRKLLQAAIEQLPDKFRIVFVLREIEEMNVEEVADVLRIPAATVKTRHLRARLRLQDALSPDLRLVLSETLPFAGRACAGVTERVLRLMTGGTAKSRPDAMTKPE